MKLLHANAGKKRDSRQRGLTLVELLVVIFIAGLLALVAIPSFQSVMNSVRQNSAVGLVMGDFNLARAEAIKRNVRILICARNADGSNCAAAATTSWAQGWVVCSEGNIANTCAANSDTNPNPIVVRPPLNASLALTASGTDPVRFASNSSRGAGSSSVILQGSWNGAKAQYICIENTGRISKRDAACST